MDDGFLNTFMTIFILAMVGLIGWGINYAIKQNERKKEERKIKNAIRYKYKDTKIGDTLTSAISRFGRDYSVEKEIKEDNKVIKVLKWYVFEYSDSRNVGAVFGATNMSGGSSGNTMGVVSGRNIKLAFIKFTFENDLLVEKEQEGLDFDVV